MQFSFCVALFTFLKAGNILSLNHACSEVLYFTHVYVSIQNNSLEKHSRAFISLNDSLLGRAILLREGFDLNRNLFFCFPFKVFKYNFCE